MSDIDDFSLTRTPNSLRLAIAAIVLLGMGIAAIGVYSFFAGPIHSEPSKLGTQGDFFGGHIAASVGALTLAIVIYSSYRQSAQQERFFTRQYFLQGAELIATAIREKDQVSGLRLIEYYSRLALSRKDGELLLILNAIIVGDARKFLESEDKNTLKNYPFSVDAMHAIGALQKRQALKRKRAVL